MDTPVIAGCEATQWRKTKAKNPSENDFIRYALYTTQAKQAVSDAMPGGDAARCERHLRQTTMLLKIQK